MYYAPNCQEYQLKSHDNRNLIKQYPRSTLHVGFVWFTNKTRLQEVIHAINQWFSIIFSNFFLRNFFENFSTIFYKKFENEAVNLSHWANRHPHDFVLNFYKKKLQFFAQFSTVILFAQFSAQFLLCFLYHFYTILTKS